MKDALFPSTQTGTFGCWFTAGLSSQREVVLAAKQGNEDVLFVASHPDERPEILRAADVSLREPPEKNAEARLAFLRDVVDQHAVRLIHAGRNGLWYENHRQDIESLGVMLTTGGSESRSFDVANDKWLFAQTMTKAGLPAVPSLRINSADAFASALHNKPLGDVPLCVKPVQGIYGAGFWRLDAGADLAHLIRDTDSRRIQPALYLEALRQSRDVCVLLMPWLQGEEYSVDMLVEEGLCLAAVQRCKQGQYQRLENEGEAICLAVQCAQVLKADGLVNIQLRRNAVNELFLLEANLRPSGGIGYTLCAGVNLPALFVQRKKGSISAQEVRAVVERTFQPVTVKALVQAVAV